MITCSAKTSTARSGDFDTFFVAMIALGIVDRYVDQEMVDGKKRGWSERQRVEDSAKKA